MQRKLRIDLPDSVENEASADTLTAAAVWTELHRLKLYKLQRLPPANGSRVGVRLSRRDDNGLL
jgi:hypothetical protein